MKPMKKNIMTIPTPTVSKLRDYGTLVLELCPEDEDNPAYDYPDEEHHDTSDSGQSVAYLSLIRQLNFSCFKLSAIMMTRTITGVCRNLG